MKELTKDGLKLDPQQRQAITTIYNDFHARLKEIAAQAEPDIQTNSDIRPLSDAVKARDQKRIA